MPGYSKLPVVVACGRITPITLGTSASSLSAQLPPDGGAEAHIINAAKGDGKLTFDKLTDVYYSGTKHEEDQPAHLVIHDTTICNERCVTGVWQSLQELLSRQCVRNGGSLRHAQRSPDPLERF